MNARLTAADTDSLALQAPFAGGMLDLFGNTARDEAIDALHAATAVYTATPVVDELLDNLDWPRGNLRMVDPSCGDGIFLGRALARLLKHRPDIDDATILNVLEGWELHPFAAGQSRARVTSILIEHGRSQVAARAVAGRMVRQADFLMEGPTEPRYDVVAGNPPYLRFCNVPTLLRDEYLARLPGHARADLLHSFLDRCAATLRADGEIGLVTADRWLFNMGAAKLRSVLGTRLSIHHLQRLDASTAFYRPKQRRAGTPPRIHPVAVVLRQPSELSIPLTANPVYPDGDLAAAGGATLNDIANVRLSPWLGSAGIFVVDEVTAGTLPREYLVPAIDTDDIKGGVLKTPYRYAIRTFPDRTPPEAVMRHLDANLHRMAARGRRPIRWMPPESWHEMSLDQEILLVPRIARSLKPVRVPPGILPINHNLSIVASGSKTLEEIEAILCSEKTNEWVRAHSPHLENGFYSLTTTRLRMLPVDDIL